MKWIIMYLPRGLYRVVAPDGTHFPKTGYSETFVFQYQDKSYMALSSYHGPDAGIYEINKQTAEEVDNTGIRVATL